MKIKPIRSRTQLGPVLFRELKWLRFIAEFYHPIVLKHVVG